MATFYHPIRFEGIVAVLKKTKFSQKTLDTIFKGVYSKDSQFRLQRKEPFMLVHESISSAVKDNSVQLGDTIRVIRGAPLGPRPVILASTGFGPFADLGETRAGRPKVLFSNRSSSSDLLCKIECSTNSTDTKLRTGLHFPPSVLLVSVARPDFVVVIPLNEAVHVFTDSMEHYWLAHAEAGTLYRVMLDEVDDFVGLFPEMAGKLNDAYASETA